MAFVIAVAQQKGGAGKSTLAANLAVALGEGGPVTLLDTDPQQSLARWHAIRVAQGHAPLRFDTPSGWRVPSSLDGLRRGPGFVVLDTPPAADTDAKQMLRAADLVLIPLQPSLPDLWASEATVALAEGERKPWRYVLNRVPPQSRVAEVVLEELARRKAPLLAERLGNRAVYATAFATGQGVTEAQPRSTAASELRALASSIRGLAGQ
ncbi:ParA family partition ATPase [Sabulicella rubraurantiaca]|uniref:ParA family partition ATPase n=1 Tax=Sabulicella rubraurantiaca TaxID=2811429 RepID=UPI001A95B2B7|nr:ParA family partition ATPase [Sabulicella rubraurantiaca]